MAAIEQHTIDFLKQLKENNERDWFHANKTEYQKAKENFLSFVQDMITAITEFDPDMKDTEAKDTMFRINRDIRFSKDKSPYKTNFGANISPGGRKSMTPGYYFHLEPEGKTMIAGGLYNPPKEQLAALRQAIDYDPDEFKSLLNDSNFKKFFNGIHDMGDKLKNAPKGYPKDHPEAELLKNKSFIVMHNVPDEIVTGPHFREYALETFMALHPFDMFLRKVIKG